MTGAVVVGRAVLLEVMGVSGYPGSLGSFTLRGDMGASWGSDVGTLRGDGGSWIVGLGWTVAGSIGHGNVVVGWNNSCNA